MPNERTIEMPEPFRPDDEELAALLIDELTAELDPDDARELAAELAKMVELGVLELDAELRVGTGPRAAEVQRPWRPLPRRTAAPEMPPGDHRPAASSDTRRAKGTPSVLRPGRIGAAERHLPSQRSRATR